MSPFPPAAVAALEAGTCPTPFDVLGIHPVQRSDIVSPPRRAEVPGAENRWTVRVFIPWARAVWLLRGDRESRPDGNVVTDTAIPMEPAGSGGAFHVAVSAPGVFPYRLRVEDARGERFDVEDPYRFPPAVDEDRVRAFLQGREIRIHQVLGAHPRTLLGVDGTLFAVWAPHAEAVATMGDMNGWDGRCHPMRPRGDTGVWELFLPGVHAGARYKYRVLGADGVVREKADPCGRAMELRPASASVVAAPERAVAPQTAWIADRPRRQNDAAPVSIYEVHLGSWRRKGGTWLTYGELAEELLPYVKALGFTHVELLPIVEHPLDESWGYQPLGFFAPTSRFGTAEDFRAFVRRAHREGVGVILDWVPGHFPEDAHGLVHFDGTPLYETSDPRQRRHPDWGTLTFDFSIPAVRAFLVASALHWLEDYGLDGLRVDAVASMLYLDYSRKVGDWTPNPEGGRENLDAVTFVRELNEAVQAGCPGTLMIAEESTSWPRVSHGTDRGGLGFTQKWNMGWMNDTLEAMSTDPLFRPGRYDRFTFSLLYAFSERYVLPLSHDEVVHGKGSLLGKMPGTKVQKLANLRALLALQWAHPGKKLLFMGAELGQETEWDAKGELPWGLLDRPDHAGVQRLVTDLNHLYRAETALHYLDFRPEGFEWLDCDDAERVTFSFLRWAPGWTDPVVVAANLTPVTRSDFLLPVPWAGRYRVLLNTDAPVYGGPGTVPLPETLDTVAVRRGGRDHTLPLSLPGLSVLFLRPERPTPPGGS